MPENIVNLDRICHTRPSQMVNRPRHRNVISIEKGSVAIAFVREALDGVVRRGLDPADFLRRAAIAPELLTLDEARVSPDAFGTLRSEENTSELQSLMRSSYDVSCLNKKH